MRRVTPVGWVLVAAVVATALLALVAPGAALVAAVIPTSAQAIMPRATGNLPLFTLPSGNPVVLDPA